MKIQIPVLLPLLQNREPRSDHPAEQTDSYDLIRGTSPPSDDLSFRPKRSGVLESVCTSINRTRHLAIENGRWPIQALCWLEWGSFHPHELASEVELRKFLTRAFSTPVRPAPQSGMFPCFFAGFLSRLPSSISRAEISRRRVSRGAITASTYPCSAAM